MAQCKPIESTIDIDILRAKYRTYRTLTKEFQRKTILEATRMDVFLVRSIVIVPYVLLVIQYSCTNELHVKFPI